MEEKMNEEQPLEDGQREEDDIDYVEDREELTEERIKDMLDAREYKELKEELETNMYPVDLAEILERFVRSIWCCIPFACKRRSCRDHFLIWTVIRERILINALTVPSLKRSWRKCIWMIPLMCWKRCLPM